jgi:hypothetical protein
MVLTPKPNLKICNLSELTVFFRGIGLPTVRGTLGWELGGELSYGPPWAHYLGGYQDRLLGGPLGLPGLRYTAPEGVEHKDCRGVVLG